MDSQPGCGSCQADKEDVIHAIRDCKTTREVWELVIPPDLATNFCTLDTKEWLVFLVEEEQWLGSRRWVVGEDGARLLVTLVMEKWRVIQKDEIDNTIEDSTAPYLKMFALCRELTCFKMRA